jgi:hypothetical protein
MAIEAIMLFIYIIVCYSYSIVPYPAKIVYYCFLYHFISVVSRYHIVLNDIPISFVVIVCKLLYLNFDCFDHTTTYSVSVCLSFVLFSCLFYWLPCWLDHNFSTDLVLTFWAELYLPSKCHCQVER